MGGDTVFSSPVHRECADLDLKGLSRRSDQRRVKGLIHIGFGHRDIVFEPARYRLIHLMDYAERRVTVLD